LSPPVCPIRRFAERLFLSPPTATTRVSLAINISLQLDAGVSDSVTAMRLGHTSPSQPDLPEPAGRV
jgi:hypothetical protein